jgi:hypothetical protein
VLAERMPLALNTSHAQGEEAALVAELLTLTGVVLLSWEHKAIAEAIVPELPLASGAPSTHWPSERFDPVLRFDRPAGAAGFTYRMLLPRLLSGDPDQGFGS